ncbi:hypothetical protein [Rhodopseudomonas palustris]|uniref:Uncharacterized protein n=1 Tax=Rhodopseudomonas palustris (strain BisB18) TaxID=316056 RepID=Q217S8_RHOPB
MTVIRKTAPAKPSARRTAASATRGSRSGKSTTSAAAAKLRASVAARRQTLAKTCKRADATLVVDDHDEVGVRLAKRAQALAAAAEASAEPAAEQLVAKPAKKPANKVATPARKTARKTVSKTVSKTATKTAAETAAETPAPSAAEDEAVAAPAAPAAPRKTRGPSGVSRTAVDRVDDPEPASGLKLLDRVSRSIEREITQIEAIVGGSHLKPEQRSEAERRARTLASLTKTLGELRRMRAAEQSRAADDDAIPRDLDEFRRALSRRLEQLVAVAAEFPAARDE